MSHSNRKPALQGAQRAVSPVIGVILMVAVTVILAAVIGTFVLNLGDFAATRPPTASVAATADPVTENVTLRHLGGDRLDASRTRIVLTNGSTADTRTWEPPGARALLAVGGAARINVSTGAIDWDGDGIDDYGATGGGIGGLQARVEYTVLLVDVPSGRVVAETTVVA